MRLIWLLLVSYLLGSYPTAAIVARRVGRFDIFRHGSGNPGTSNIFRLVGLRWALVVLTVDVLKGYLPLRLSEREMSRIQESWPGVNSETIKALVGLAAVGGHVFPLSTGFHGGKGTATLAGVLAGIVPRASLATLLAYLLTLRASKQFSVATLTASLTFPLAVYALEGNRSIASLGWSGLVPLLLMATHRDNIRRLRMGQELKMRESMERTSWQS